ncbi:FepC ABC-type cobalamin/Fe3+-siderophores transport systems, ATPase components [Candidatus Nanopelagicaceae bacterium]
MISIKDISISRAGRLVVEKFNAELKPGTITAVIGPNGSGKSSLLAAIAGDLALTGGEITIGGQRILDLSLSELAAQRSVVLQSHNYWLSYTVREIVAMGQDEAAITRIDEIFRSLDMVELSKRAVTTLSGGESQRVEIARALIRNTQIYLLDEPLSAQDSASRVRIIELLKKLRSQGKIIFIVTHSDERVLDWCDQIFDLGA